LINSAFFNLASILVIAFLSIPSELSKDSYLVSALEDNEETIFTSASISDSLTVSRVLLEFSVSVSPVFGKVDSNSVMTIFSENSGISSVEVGEDIDNCGTFLIGGIITGFTELFCREVDDLVKLDSTLGGFFSLRNNGLFSTPLYASPSVTRR
jgi:hypothetical protein